VPTLSPGVEALPEGIDFLPSSGASGSSRYVGRSEGGDTQIDRMESRTS
jgi:hypothetical protein